MHIFEGIGRIGSYVQMKNLRREMQFRIRTGTSLSEALGAPQDPGRTRATALQPPTGAERDEMRAARIRQKLRQGQKLSAGDMQYLKDADPDLYEKAVRIEERREELARALKRAKTKDEAMRAVTQANIAVLAEMKASGGAEAPSLHSAMQGAAGSAAASAAASAAGDGGMGIDDGADALSADMTAEPSAAEMNAAIAGDAIAEQDAAAPAGAQEEASRTAEGARSEDKAEEKLHEKERRHMLTPEEKDQLRRSAVEGSRLTPLDNEHIYQLRAYQREWMEYTHSEEYKNLPDTALDAAEEDLHGGRRRRRHAGNISAERPAPSPAEILAAAQRYYYTLHDRAGFTARG